MQNSLPGRISVQAVRALPEGKKGAVLRSDWETALLLVQAEKTIPDLEQCLVAFLAQPTVSVARRRSPLSEGEAFDAKPEIRSLQMAKVAANGRIPTTTSGTQCSTPSAFWLRVSVGRGIPALSPEDLALAFVQYLGGGSILRARQISLGRRIPEVAGRMKKDRSCK